MDSKKVGLAAGAVATLGIAIIGGTAIADAASSDGSSNGSSNGPASAAYGVPGPDGEGSGGRGGPGHDHTPVTGAELTKVTGAVEAEDPDVTVQNVQQDPDGSYDVFGTKAGSPVMLEVSADLETVTENTGAPGRGGFGDHDRDGGPGSDDTPVTGAELTRVTRAVEREDSAVTVESVRKDPDGSYDVVGTKAGAPVLLEVSADLKSVTERWSHDHPGDPGTAPAPSESSTTAFLES